MLLVYILTWILESVGNPTAIEVWHWFGHHVLLTVLMLLFLA